MVEPEMAFYDLNDNMALAEAFLKRIITDALGKCAEDMKFFDERIDKEAVMTPRSDSENRFPARDLHRGRRHPRNRARRSSSP